MPHRNDILPVRVPLGVLIRFKNSETTLPGVLSALRAQSRQPDLILGVDTGSTDSSPALIREAGGEVVFWPHPYHHSKVLNFGLARCPAERVLVLSSHTVLESPDALGQLDACLDDPQTACASGKWDDDSYYSDAINWEELRAKGLKIGSIYSNSFGLLRRRLWEDVAFDETLPTMEDYAWAVAQVSRGNVCRRVQFPFSYQRAPSSRDYEFTACAFHLAARHRLPVRWLGRKQTLLACLRQKRSGPDGQALATMHRERLLASLLWRWRLR